MYNIIYYKNFKSYDRKLQHTNKNKFEVWCENNYFSENSYFMDTKIIYRVNIYET